MADIFDASIEALRNIANGQDKWILADALLAEVEPNNSRTGFDAVRDAAVAAGLVPPSVANLRAMRDTAAHWPPDTRVDGVTFSAHRAALPASNPGDLIRDLVQQYGVRKVTVKRVHDEIVMRGHSRRTTAVTATAKVPDTVDLTTTRIYSMLLAIDLRIKGGDINALADEILAESDGESLALATGKLLDKVRTRGQLQRTKAARWKAGSARSAKAAAEADADQAADQDADQDAPPVAAASGADAPRSRRRKGDLRGL